MTALSINQAIASALGGKKPTEPLEDVEIVCGTHGPYLASGYRLMAAKPPRNVYSECPGCKKDAAVKTQADIEASRAVELKAKIESMLVQSAIPPRFIGKTFDNYRADTEPQSRALRICRLFAEQFPRQLKTGGSLILSGKPGTGKSHLAGAVLQAILPGHVGVYVTLMDLIRTLRDTWRKDSEISESQMLARLQAVPLLCIDEIGVQYGTDSERAILFDVLDRRYRELRPSILMTNLSKDDFRVAIGDRVYDRLTEVARWVPFDWPSYRPQAREELRDIS